MARWEPDARRRLAEAAMELFAERGYEQTTAAEIAQRAGLTERTFFRHFADKPEVLFGGGTEFQERFVTAVAAAAESATPIDAIDAALQAGAEMLQERRDFSRRRQAIIAATPELQERELMKLVSLAGALRDALRDRGTPEPTATLTGEVAVTIFRIAFERWVAGGHRDDLRQLMRESLDELRAVAAGRASALGR